MKKREHRISMKLSDLDDLIRLASYAVAYNPGGSHIKPLTAAFTRINRRRIQMHDRIIQRLLEDESE